MMPRTFHAIAVSLGDTVSLQGDVAHHYLRVLRAKLGEELVLSTPNGS